MRKNKKLIINGQINEVISSIGHFQKLIICDPGLPIPLNAQIVDISLTANIPSFIDVYNLIVEEMDVERVILATEIIDKNKNLHEKIVNTSKRHEIKIDSVSHEEFKKLMQDGYCFIRTGETSVYANCIIEAGVKF